MQDRILRAFQSHRYFESWLQSIGKGHGRMGDQGRVRLYNHLLEGLK